MPTNVQRSRELGWLVLLFALYLAGTYWFERQAQQTTRIETPSSFNAKAPGVKAYYLLLEKQNIRANRLRAPWSSLTVADGMLVVTEPLDPQRPVGREEIKVLKQWVEAGGTLLYFVAPPVRITDTSNIVFGDIAIVDGEDGVKTTAPEKSANPLLQNVKTLSYRSAVRLKTAERAGYTTLARDADGALLIQKPLGKGQLLVSAMGDIVSNAAIEHSDNVLLLANIAALVVGDSEKTVAFDEYHHGVGFEGSEDNSAEGVWAITPLSLRLLCYGAVALGLLMLYNGNLWFGPLRKAPIPNYRASTDYVGSVAGLLHRAKAADVAVAALYSHFIVDLRRNLDLAPEVGPDRIAGEAQRLYGVNSSQLQHCLLRCQAAAQGQTVSETELVELAQQLEYFRRACHLV